MPWARIDDTLYDHPKTLSLIEEKGGMAAVGLFTLLLSYCNRHLTDGAFTLVNARRCGGTAAMIGLLVAHGFVDQEGDAYRIHDFLSYSKSREKVDAERDAWRVRQQRSRADVTDMSRRDTGVSHAHVTRMSHSPVPIPVPIPVPDPLAERASDDPDDDITTLQKLAESLTGTPYGFPRHGGMGDKVAGLLAKHGLPAVEAEWRRIAGEERGMPTVRQLVLGADNALNRISAPAPAGPRDEVADFVARVRAGAVGA